MIETLCDEHGQEFFWSLTRKGFEHVKIKMPILREDGYKSENKPHDRLVTAVHLGDGLLRDLPTIETVTEQELRRFDDEFFPKWTPLSSLHRPDGYWHRPESRTTIALEVELTSKRVHEYVAIGKFYDRYQNISKVIWVVPALTTAKRIHQLLLKEVESERKQHAFFLVPDFQAKGWGANCIEGGDFGVTMRQMILENACTPVGQEWDRFPVKLMSDGRKRRTYFEEFHAWQKLQQN